MAFSDQAIGFYLQLEDELTPQLSKAGDAYAKFVKSIETHNKVGFATMNKGFADLGGLVQQFGGMTDNLAKNYELAVKKVQKKAKPLTQKIDIQFTGKSMGGFKKAIGEAVGKALAGASLRLRATMPAHKLKMYDTSASLRTIYKDIPQPPDMVGKLKIQKFAKGGEVLGSQKGFDSVLAALQPGEVVLPKDLVDTLKNLDTNLRDVEGLKGVLDAGLGTPAELKAYNKSILELADNMGALTQQSKNLGSESRQRMAPVLKDVSDRMEDLGKETEKTGSKAENLLKNILGPARFMQLHTSVRSVQKGLKALTSVSI